MSEWRFYGRSTELDALTGILNRRRWFFAKITGRRRIGKTTLVQRAIAARGSTSLFYVQIPDSGDAGVPVTISALGLGSAFNLKPCRMAGWSFQR